MTVRLHIERLVVEGLDLTRAEAARVGAALEAELTERLAGMPPGSWSDRAMPVLTAAPMTVPHQPGPEPLGRAAGAALHRGLSS
jgi:hypothetical protein